MYWWSRSASARADSRSWPNGFSTTTRAFFVSPAPCETFDDAAEQERWDLEVEDGRLRRLDRLADARVGGLIAEVAGNVREAVGEALEDGFVERLARADDRVARPFDQLLLAPVVDCDADDRAVDQPASLEPVQRPERHHLRQVAGDPEDHQHVRCLRFASRPAVHCHCSTPDSCLVVVRRD